MGDPNLSSWRIGIPLLEMTPGFLPSNSLTSRWGEAVVPPTWECGRAETAIPPELGLGVQLEELRPGQSVVVYSGIHGSPTLLPNVCEGDGPAMRGLHPQTDSLPLHVLLYVPDEVRPAHRVPLLPHPGTVRCDNLLTLPAPLLPIDVVELQRVIVSSLTAASNLPLHHSGRDQRTPTPRIC